MIFDQVNQLHRYSFPFKEEIQKFLNRDDLLSFNDSEIEICSRDLFVRIMRYQPKPALENKFEAHQIYADVQVILSGREIMQVAPEAQVAPTTEYHTENDYQFFQIVQGEVTDLVVSPQTFVVFFPGEIHRPSCLISPKDNEVLKLVFKVRIK